MSIFENVKSAFKNVFSNKLRTFLTMLGIIIGIAAVIAITSIGNGSQEQITEQFDSLGVGRITVSLRSNSPRNMVMADALTYSDYEELKEMTGVKYISPVYNGNNASVKLLDPKETNNASISGVTPDYQYIMSPTLLYGRYINDSDVEAKSKVVVINDTTAKKVFGYCNQSVVGQKISIKTWQGSFKYTVIGITENSDAETESLYENEYPEKMVVPITSAFRLFNRKTLANIILVAEDPDNADSLCSAITDKLSEIHKNSDKYAAESAAEQMEALNEVTGTVTMLISGVAAISLIVGGIGVMNIMLVTVTERTREIGIRKSIGAKNKDIMIQFVIEAIILTGIGGILGVIFGWVFGLIAGEVLGISSVVSANSVGMAVLISTSIGIIFGVYPAKKAANLDPIEALRYE